MKPHQFGGSWDGDGEGDDGSDDMTSYVNSFNSDHVDQQHVRAPGEGSSVLYGGGSSVDQQGSDCKGVLNTSDIGPMEDQRRANDNDSTEDETVISNARVDVETASHPTPTLHIIDDDSENYIASSSQQAKAVHVWTLDPSLTDHPKTFEVSVMLNIN